MNWFLLRNLSISLNLSNYKQNYFHSFTILMNFGTIWCSLFYSWYCWLAYFFYFSRSPRGLSTLIIKKKTLANFLKNHCITYVHKSLQNLNIALKNFFFLMTTITSPSLWFRHRMLSANRSLPFIICLSIFSQS